MDEWRDGFGDRGGEKWREMRPNGTNIHTIPKKGFQYKDGRATSREREWSSSKAGVGGLAFTSHSCRRQ